MANAHFRLHQPNPPPEQLSSFVHFLQHENTPSSSCPLVLIHAWSVAPLPSSTGCCCPRADLATLGSERGPAGVRNSEPASLAKGEDRRVWVSQGLGLGLGNVICFELNLFGLGFGFEIASSLGWAAVSLSLTNVFGPGQSSWRSNLQDLGMRIYKSILSWSTVRPARPGPGASSPHAAMS
ncbi:uncharacterized protein N7477_001877 [Penicillium maclennaniae]|uniref:uncharacterized protein n=1 Tax=Penicillium maclennaniae TaxID=1343394 RepID=UPI0025410FE2|nr:uncharacterized protein N7477_001877 [Penicillium maclennaniae]KAJ5681937.1 hypothetical protein N7477_001877 [Penicillium maclennaniae]